MTSEVKHTTVDKVTRRTVWLSDRRLQTGQISFEDVCFRGRAYMIFPDKHTAGIFSPRGDQVKAEITIKWTEKVRVR